MDAIVIMAKAPLDNEVKTRLIPLLGPDGAARLYHNFLLDKIEQVRSIDGPCHYIAFSPPDEEDFFKSIIPRGFLTIPQKGSDLGERLSGISCLLFKKGCQRVLLLDSDTPTLPPMYIRKGLRHLDEKDVVLGPCEDGGYYLIGLRSCAPDLFQGIPWSTSEVTSMTIKKAADLGLTVSLLDPWYDIDTPEALVRLKNDLNNAGSDFCRNTRRFCKEMFNL